MYPKARREMTTRNGKQVTLGQADVYDVLAQYGPLPDHALVPLAQHVVHAHQSSSGIRTRRRELQEIGLVRPTGQLIPTSSGRMALEFEVA
jgi:hypothetical protein